MTNSGHPDAMPAGDRQAKEWLDSLVLNFWEPIWRMVREANVAESQNSTPSREGMDRVERFVEQCYAALPEVDRQILDVYEIINEVENGGIDQFLANSTGDRAEETLHALKSIGATESAGIVTKAMALFPNGKPSRAREERLHELEQIRDSHAEMLEELADHFCDRQEDLYALLLSNWNDKKKSSNTAFGTNES
jgi:hypothetical protein